jgi:hypothetical protein
MTGRTHRRNKAASIGQSEKDSEKRSRNRGTRTGQQERYSQKKTPRTEQSEQDSITGQPGLDSFTEQLGQDIKNRTARALQQNKDSKKGKVMIG